MALSMQLFALLAIGLSVVHAEGNFELKVSLDKKKANLGETLTVTCDITNDSGQSRFTNVWIKKVEEEEVEYGVNSFINMPFSKTGRASVEYYYNDPDSKRRITFILTLRNVQASDSGEFGCKIMEGRIEAFEDFIVMVPVSMVKLNSKDANGTHAVNYVNQQEVTFDEGEVRQMACYVNGSYPEPEVKMMIGDDDVSSLFERKSRLVKDGPYPGMQALTYEVSLTNDSFPILYSYSGKQVRCVASVPKTPFPEQEVAITVKLAGYRPKFLCEETQMTGVHQIGFNISCRVRSDPEVQDYKFHWDKMSEGNETLIAGEQSGHYRAEVHPGKNEFETIMVLYIDRVFIQHFRDYYFEAENDLGRVRHTIKLRRDLNIERLLQEESEKKKREEEVSRKDPQTGQSVGGAEKTVATCSLITALLLLLSL